MKRKNETLNIHPGLGYSFESFVIEELLKGLNALLITNWHCYYFRSKTGSEIDVILEGNFGILPIEIKYNTHTASSKIPALKYFIKENNIPMGLVINNSESVELIEDNIIQVPLGLI